MNAHLLGFFSGFPTRHFPNDIAERLKEELSVRDSLVFVSAWPSDAERNDSDAAGMHGMFVECNMAFERYCVIDNRTDALDAQRLIREASCIFLMGGHAVQQFQLICEKGIKEEICKSCAVILGVSAGSSNMAKRALDIWESLVPYDGLGLADITVKAHVQQDSQGLLQTLRQVSVEQNLPICAMADESAIFVKDGHATPMGQIQWVNKGNVCPLSPEILEQMMER
ncbi:MAG: Type 1 glutamine amidotransferase-like domain-containing protein [Clostridia bacterium]|nr:Type 1 glutamine amidotransferase-like domain-containing protein [Clostridia bacterium]